jgi:sporulation protein YlmC with PRC-barrel domain
MSGSQEQRSRPAGRVLHGDLHLMDRQIVDAGGRMVAKVDDVELDLGHDPPIVTALLTGPQAWGPRLPGLLGRFVITAHRRLSEDSDPQPRRIAWAEVVDIDSAVHIGGSIRDRNVSRWSDEQVISRIPGATDETE